MKTVGHHTCSQNGGSEFVLLSAPFCASDTEKTPQFLGTGYYLWDNNLEMAKVWGRKHYSNKYFILEFKIELSESNCLDLVGNRNHMILFRKFAEKSIEKDSKIKNFDLSKMLNLFHRSFSTPASNLNFEIVRLVDLYNHDSTKAQYKIKIADHRSNYTILNPKFILFSWKKDFFINVEKKIAFSAVDNI